MILTVNSKFRPFSYDELVKPLVQYKQAYDEVEKDYSTLAAQTEAWKDIATQENNPEAYAMYKKYSDELNALTDDFSKGMNINNRSQLMAMKKRYASEITPIAKADAALKEANKYRDTIYAKDPNAIFYKDRYSSLDDFLHGKTADNSYISGTQVTSRTAARAQAVGTQLYNKYIAEGMKPNEAMAAIQSDPTLQAIYNEEWTAANGDALDATGQARLQNAIRAGINNATAKVAEGEYMTAAQRDAQARGWASIKETKRQHDVALKMKGYDSDGNIDPNNPYWKTQDLAYDETTGTWTKIAKPGTAKSGASGSEGTRRVDRLTKSIVLDKEGKVQGEDIALDKTYKSVKYDELPIELKAIAASKVGDDSGGYDYYLKDTSGWFEDPKYEHVAIVPRENKVVGAKDAITPEQLEEALRKAQQGK